MKGQTARQLRKLHHYIGLFFTPAILFFAFSGALQTLGLHENRGGGPPAATWIRWMASVHKDQHLLGKPAAETLRRHSEDGGKRDHSEHRQDEPSPIPMKAFVLLLSIGLCISSLLGVTIALTNPVARRSAIITLILGTLVPIALLFV